MCWLLKLKPEIWTGFWQTRTTPLAVVFIAPTRTAAASSIAIETSRCPSVRVYMISCQCFLTMFPCNARKLLSMFRVYMISGQCFLTMFPYNVSLQCVLTLLPYNVSLQCFLTMFPTPCISESNYQHPSLLSPTHIHTHPHAHAHSRHRLSHNTTQPTPTPDPPTLPLPLPHSPSRSPAKSRSRSHTRTRLRDTTESRVL